MVKELRLRFRFVKAGKQTNGVKGSEIVTRVTVDGG